MKNYPYGTAGLLSLISGIVILLATGDFNPLGMILMLGGLVMVIVRMLTMGKTTERADMPPAEEQQKTQNTGVYIFMTLAVLAIAVIISIAPKNTTTQTSQSQSTAYPTSIPKPTKTVGHLPGLMPADVKVNLEDRSIKCADVKQGELYYIWTCQRSDPYFDVYIEIYSKSLGTVDYINAVVTQPGATATDEISSPILGFIATMPYDDATPALARVWVENNLPDITGAGITRENTFSGVKYTLFGPATARTLQIGALD